jgi:hypothetical protein
MTTAIDLMTTEFPRSLLPLVDDYGKDLAMSPLWVARTGSSSC